MEDVLNLQPGQVVQGQTLVEKIGEGGFGEVWKAEYFGQPVALKFFHRSDRLEGSRRETIAQYVLGRLKYEDGGRFFPRVEHFDLEATPPYMRMELIDGKSLTHHFTKGAQFDTGKALRVAEGLLSGLVVVHDMGFLHGDLSASNVLLTADEKVKLIDVGYGLLFQESSDLALSTAGSLGVSVGAATPMYSAPERFTKDFLVPDVGKRCDVYSFGKVLYQLLAWESPATVKPVSRKVAVLGSEWDDFVFRCVSDRAQDRFADARAALAAFQELPLAVEVVPGGERTDTKVRKNVGKFRSLVEIALADRVLTAQEREYLRTRAEQMGIPFEEAEKIIQEMARPGAAPIPPPPPPPVSPQVEGTTVACRRCSQPNIVPPGASPSFYACSACGANLGTAPGGCPQCGRALETKRAGIGAIILGVVLLCAGGALFDRHEEETAWCVIGAAGLAIVLGIASAAKRPSAWCPSCRRAFPNLAGAPASGGLGLGCLLLLVLALFGGIIAYVVSEYGGPW